MTSDNVELKSTNFNVDSNGEVIVSGTENTPKFKVLDSENINSVFIAPTKVWLKHSGKTVAWLSIDNSGKGSLALPLDGYATFYGTGTGTEINSEKISTPYLTQTSLMENKKNFEKLENGLDIIKHTEIYKYNLKSQTDGDKKHIGFVIGENYKYSSEITSLNDEGKETGVDLYSMIAVAYKAMQELVDQNEQLQKRIKSLEKRINND